MKKIITIIALIVCGLVNAQNDSLNYVQYSPRFEFKEGIYLSFEQVKYNTPISKARIVSTTDYQSIDFFNEIFANPYIELYDNYGIKQQIPTQRVWGYCQKGTLYINWNDNFHRIPVVGSISHFVANKTVYDVYNNNMYYSYPYYTPQTTAQTVELRQYILDFSSGQVYDYTIENLESLLSNDTELFEEFLQLRNRKKKKLHFYYLRQYNLRNPLYLPINNE